jgi:hypothetical protein
MTTPRQAELAKPYEPTPYERRTLNAFYAKEKENSPAPSHGGGARLKRRTQPHERGLSLPKKPAVLGNLEAD